MARTGLTFTGIDDTVGFTGAKARASTFRIIQASLEDFEKTHIQTIHNDSISPFYNLSTATGVESFGTIVTETQSNGSAIVIYEAPICVPAGVQNVIAEMSGKYVNNIGKITLTGKIDLLQLDGTAFTGSSTSAISKEVSSTKFVRRIVPVETNDIIFTPILFRFTSELSAQQEAVLKYYITLDSNNPATGGDMAVFRGSSFATFALME